VLSVDGGFYACQCSTLTLTIDYTPGGGPTPTGDMLLLF